MPLRPFNWQFQKLISELAKNVQTKFLLFLLESAIIILHMLSTTSLFNYVNILFMPLWLPLELLLTLSTSFCDTAVMQNLYDREAARGNNNTELNIKQILLIYVFVSSKNARKLLCLSQLI